VIAPGDGTGPLRWYECVGNPEISADWIGHDLLDRDMIHGHSLQLADIDGDGKGNFRKTIFSTGIGFHEARVADLNGDGKMDILDKPCKWGTPRVDVWLQMPAGGF
jgi:hypothetical protein